MPNNLSGNGGFSTSDLREALGYLKDIRDMQEQINTINVSPKADDSDIKKLNKEISELKQNIENQPKTTSQLFDTKIIQNNINKAQSQLDKFYDKIKSKERDLTPLQTKSFLQNYKTLEKYTEHFGEDLISKYKSIYDEMMASYSKNTDLPSYRTSSVSKDLIKNVQVTKSEFKSMLDEIQIETENLFNQDLFDANKQATASLYKEQRNALLAQKQAIQDNAEAVSNAEREKREQILATRDTMAKNIESIVNEKLSGVNENQYIKIDDKSWGEVQQKFYDMTQFLSNLGLEVEDIEKSFAKLQNATYVDSSKIEEAKNKLQQMASTSQTAAEGVNKVSDSVNNVAGSNQDGVATGIGKIAKETEQASQDMQAYGSASTEAFDSSKLGAYVSLLEEVRNILNDISTTLGSVDRSSGFGNLISNVDVLLEKLDTVSKTIGNAQYGAEANSVLKATRNRYGTAYDKVVSKAGGEELLFSYINNALDIKGGIDELYNSFSSTSVSNIDSIEMQIYRMMDFFKLLRQAMSTGEFGLDLSGIQIPAGNDKALQKRIKEASTKGAKEGQIINVESDKDSLIAITDKLIEIKNLLSEISQKNLFGDSLNVFSSKLDEIVGKFEILVADVKVINETPIQTTDAGTGTKLDELKERIDVGKETQEQIKTTEEEISKSKQFIENAYKETAQKLAQFFNVPKNAYEELFQLVSSTHIDVKNIDKVIDFLQSKSQSLTEQTDPIWTQVKDYVSKSKIKLSQGDVSEFGDDFKSIRSVIGINTLNKTTGSDALTFLNELNSLFGNIIPEANTTQDAIRNLYEYLSKPIKIPIEPFSERDFVDTTYWEIEQARDKIKEQYDKSNQKIFNNTNSNNIQEATDAIEAEGNAAETAATKKEKFVSANEKVANSGKNTATSTSEATTAVKAEGDAAEDSAAATVAWIEGLSEAEGKTKKLDQATKEAIKSSKEMANNGSSLDLWSSELEKVQAETEKAKQKTDELNAKIGKQKATIGNVGIKTDSTLQTNADFSYSDEVKIKISDVNKEIERLKRELDNITSSEGLKKWNIEFSTLKENIRSVNNSIKEEENAYKSLVKAEEEKTEKEQKAYSQANKDYSAQLKKLAEFKMWVNQNSAAYKTFGKEIESVYSKLGGNAHLTAEEMREVSNEINRIKTSAADAGKLGNTLFSTIKARAKSLIAYVSTFASFYRIVSYIRTAFTTIKELDTQLVDLRKTTTMTTTELNEFYNASSDVAKQLGVTTSEIISQAAAWSRFNKIDPLYGNI